jgi:hypothetical protein
MFLLWIPLSDTACSWPQSPQTICGNIERMRLKPQCARRAGGIEPKLLPPRRFVAVTMNFAMVSPA